MNALNMTKQMTNWQTEAPLKTFQGEWNLKLFPIIRQVLFSNIAVYYTIIQVNITFLPSRMHENMPSLHNATRMQSHCRGHIL
jgi:hypothetical protein